MPYAVDAEDVRTIDRVAVLARYDNSIFEGRLDFFVDSLHFIVANVRWNRKIDVNRLFGFRIFKSKGGQRRADETRRGKTSKEFATIEPGSVLTHCKRLQSMRVSKGGSNLIISTTTGDFKKKGKSRVRANLPGKRPRATSWRTSPLRFSRQRRAHETRGVV